MLSTTTLINRIRVEYQSLPGLKLTAEQARRLWAVDDDTCGAALDALIAEGFLHRTGTGKFIALPRPLGYTAKAGESIATSTPIRCPHCQKLNTMERETADGGTIAGASFRCVACRRFVTFTAISA
jgi:hypothetical protein